MCIMYDKFYNRTRIVILPRLTLEEHYAELKVLVESLQEVIGNPEYAGRVCTPRIEFY